MVQDHFTIAGNTAARKNTWGVSLREPHEVRDSGIRYYSLNDIHLDGWDKQVQTTTSLKAICNEEFTEKRNLMVCPRNLSPEIKKGLVELTQFYIEREGIAEGQSKLLILHSSEHMMFEEHIRQTIFKGVETLSHNAQEASKLVFEDTMAFKANSQGSYTRLRVQGPNCINNDSPIHLDGARNHGIRYSGVMTDEFHDDDVSPSKENRQIGHAKENARILRLEQGDVWAHRGNPMFSPASMMGKALQTRSGRWHRKSDSSQAGMVLTMQ